MEDFVTTIPPWTLTYLISSAVLAATATYRLVKPTIYTLELAPLLRGQVWRLITSFVYVAPFSAKFFFHLVFVYGLHHTKEL